MSKREKTDLKTLILAAQAGRKFEANCLAFSTPRMWNQEDFLEQEFMLEHVIGEWEVDWIKEPLKWEGEIYFGSNDFEDRNYFITKGNNSIPQACAGKWFKITLTEIVRGK